MVSVAVVEFCPTAGELTEQKTVMGKQLRVTWFEPLPVMVSATVPLCPEVRERLGGLAVITKGGGGLIISLSGAEVLPL